MKEIATALESHATDYDEYPAAELGDLSLIIDDLVPAYSRELPMRDGWGQPFLYIASPERYVLWSKGRNGVADVRPGGGVSRWARFDLLISNLWVCQGAKGTGVKPAKCPNDPLAAVRSQRQDPSN